MRTKKVTKDESETEVKPKRKYKARRKARAKPAVETEVKRKYERKANKPEARPLVSRSEWEAGMARETEKDMKLVAGFLMGVFTPMLRDLIQEEVKAALAQLKMQGQSDNAFGAFNRWQGEQKRMYGSFT